MLSYRSCVVVFGNPFFEGFPREPASRACRTARDADRMLSARPDTPDLLGPAPA